MSRRRPEPSIYRFTVNTYANRKGESRVAVLMSEGEARKLAQGHDIVIGALVDALCTELWETRPNTNRIQVVAQ